MPSVRTKEIRVSMTELYRNFPVYPSDVTKDCIYTLTSNSSYAANFSRYVENLTSVKSVLGKRAKLQPVRSLKVPEFKKLRPLFFVPPTPFIPDYKPLPFRYKKDFVSDFRQKDVKLKDGQTLRKPVTPNLSNRKLLASLRYQKAVNRWVKQNDRRFSRYHQWVQSVYDAYKVRLEKKRAAYEAALARYDAAYLLYKEKFAKWSTGHVRPLRNSKNGRKIVLMKPNNPYSRTIVQNWPILGQMRSVTYYDRYGLRNYGLSSQQTQWYSSYQYDGWIGDFVNSTYSEPDTASSASALAASETRAIAKVYEKLNQFDLHVGNLLAERKKTLDMLAEIVKAVARFKVSKAVRLLETDVLRFLKYLSPKHPESRKLADAHLATMFGVLPLLKDAYQLGHSLALLDHLPDSLVVRAREQCVSSSASVLHVLSGGLPWYDKFTTVTTTVKISYVLEYAVTNRHLVTQQGLGLLNPAEPLWEITPWSFVVDWFLPIGNYIQHLSADAGLTFSRGTKTVTTTKRYELSYRSAPGQSPGRRLYLSGTGSRVVETKVRTVLSSAPVLRLPRFQNKLFTPTHLSEAIALLRQRFK